MYCPEYTPQYKKHQGFIISGQIEQETRVLKDLTSDYAFKDALQQILAKYPIGSIKAQILTTA